MRSEQEIVKSLIRGNSRAFDEMYGLYCDRIWRFLVRLTQDTTLSEDLFQETWLAAASHAHLLREDTSLVRWLYTIARNAYRMSWRKRRADLTKCVQLYYPIDGPRSPDDAFAARIDIERVGAAMMRLPQAFREVIVLCCLEELSSEDAAAVLEISKEAVRKRLSRARAELAAMLNITRITTIKRKSS
jgi:RNA polymerase sigma factor (sigma-70 family)